METRQQGVRTLLSDIKNYIPAAEMFDMDNRNYEWESIKYKMPKAYHGQPVKHMVFKDGKVPKRTNFLDDLQKTKKQIPGPCHYKIQEQIRPVSGKMDKQSRKTMSEAVIDRSKKENTPGPTNYFQRPKTAQQPSRPKSSVSNSKQHYIHQLQYLANQSPGVGQYSIFREPYKIVPGPKLKANSTSNLHTRPKSKSKPKQKHGVVQGTFEWISLQKKKENSRFFGSCKRFVEGSKYDKKPAPNSYKLKVDWKSQSNIDKLVTSSSSANLKSVYYS